MREYEKDGIIYVEDPERINLLDFGCDHLDCAFICGSYQESNSSGIVVAYASKPEYGNKLRQIFEEKYQREGYMYSLGISSEMVNGIDQYI